MNHAVFPKGFWFGGGVGGCFCFFFCFCNYGLTLHSFSYYCYTLLLYRVLKNANLWLFPYLFSAFYSKICIINYFLPIKQNLHWLGQLLQIFYFLSFSTANIPSLLHLNSIHRKDSCLSCESNKSGHYLHKNTLMLFLFIIIFDKVPLEISEVCIIFFRHYRFNCHVLVKPI